MSDPLQDSRDSVEHAKRRIRELEAEIVAFGKAGEPTEISELDHKTGEQVVKVRLNMRLPRSFRGIAVDAAGSLRQSLDQAGFAIAIAAGTKGKNAHFPFGGNRGDVEAKKKGRSRDIPQEIFDVMVACKPYKGGNDTLWALNKLANTNKHEIIVPLITECGGYSIESAAIGGPLTIVNKWNRAKEELEVLRVGPGGKFQGQLQFRFHVLLDDLAPITAKDAVGSFDAITCEVERVLMAIEGEARRIGLFT